LHTSRKSVFLHAVAFVLGFSIVFVSLGASVAFIGYALSQWMLWIQRVGGLLIVVFGLSTMGLIKLPFLYMDRRVQYRKRPSLGYASSVLMGIFFSAGWIPCVGPVLAAIYLLASNTRTAAQGALLLAIYSLGLGIPFLVTGAAFSTMTGILRRLNRHLRVVSIITGLLLVAIGALLLLDQFTALAGWLTARLGTGLATAELSGDPSARITFPLAFAAGFLSFLSPCVLPLIPGYLSYLSGAAVTSSSKPTTS
jgi:cytochrome c-type biogenesis protein